MNNPSFVRATLSAMAMLLIQSHAAFAADIPFFSSGAAIDKNQWRVSDGWTNGDHQGCEWRSDAISAAGGDLVLRLSDHGGKLRPYGCAEIQSTARTGYGLYETRLRTAAGSGLNTAFFTFAGPPDGVPQQDEIDFEFLGKDPRTVQLNYYTGGVGQHEKIIQLGFDASKDFHVYGLLWQQRKITWYVDGNKVYETPEGASLPSHPGRILLSLWSGAHPSDAWLGPFTYSGPVTAEVSWVKYKAIH